MLRWPLNLRALPLFALLLAAAFSFSLGFLWSEELWWYLASGEFILERGAIPERDPFVHALDPPAPWLGHSWLWTVALAALDRAFGLGALPILGSALVAAILTSLYTRARVDRFGLVNALIVAPVVVAGIQRFSLRAELPGWLLLVVFVFALERPVFRWRAVVALVALQILWANLHAGFALGILVAAVYAVGGAVQDRLPNAPPDRRGTAPRLWLVPALAIASLLTSPRLAEQRVAEALGVLRRLFSQDPSGTGALMVYEWMSPFSQGFGPMPWIYGICLVGGLASFAVTRAPRSLPRFLLLAVFAVLGAWASRFVIGTALAAALAALGNLRELDPRVRARWESAMGPLVRALYAVAVAAVGAVFATTAVATWQSRRDYELGQSAEHFFTLNPRFSAPGAARFLRENDVRGPIFNEMELGGYLIHALYPEPRVFIDGRILSTDLLREHGAILHRPARWREAARRYGFESVVLSNLSRAQLPLRSVLAADPDWRLAFRDVQASVFVRVAPGSPVPSPAPPRREGAGELPFLGADAASAWQQGVARWLVGQRPRGLVDRYIGALIQLGEHAEAEALASIALARRPDLEFARVHRGHARLRLGRFEEAEEDLRIAAEAAPEDPNALRNHALALERLGRTRAARLQREKARRLDSK